VFANTQKFCGGPEILDHQGLRSYRNSVIVVPEILWTKTIAIIQKFCGIPEILDHRCFLKFWTIGLCCHTGILLWSTNSGPSVFAILCLAIIQKFCGGPEFRNSGPSGFALIQKFCGGPEILDHQGLPSYSNSVVVQKFWTIGVLQSYRNSLVVQKIWTIAVCNYTEFCGGPENLDHWCLRSYRNSVVVEKIWTLGV
jgi:hypothetical protein